MVGFKEAIIIVLVSCIASASSIFELFKITNLLGQIFTLISYLYTPAFILAIFLTQKADPPGQIGVVVGALIQTYLMYMLFRFTRSQYAKKIQNT